MLYSFTHTAAVGIKGLTEYDKHFNLFILLLLSSFARPSLR